MIRRLSSCLSRIKAYHSTSIFHHAAYRPLSNVPPRRSYDYSISNILVIPPINRSVGSKGEYLSVCLYSDNRSGKRETNATVLSGMPCQQHPIGYDAYHSNLYYIAETGAKEISLRTQNIYISKDELDIKLGDVKITAMELLPGSVLIGTDSEIIQILLSGDHKGSPKTRVVHSFNKLSGKGIDFFCIDMTIDLSQKVFRVVAVDNVISPKYIFLLSVNQKSGDVTYERTIVLPEGSPTEHFKSGVYRDNLLLLMSSYAHSGGVGTQIKAFRLTDNYGHGCCVDSRLQVHTDLTKYPMLNSARIYLGGESKPVTAWEGEISHLRGMVMMGRDLVVAYMHSALAFVPLHSDKSKRVFEEMRIVSLLALDLVEFHILTISALSESDLLLILSRRDKAHPQLLACIAYVETVGRGDVAVKIQHSCHIDVSGANGEMDIKNVSFAKSYHLPIAFDDLLGHLEEGAAPQMELVLEDVENASVSDVNNGQTTPALTLSLDALPPATVQEAMYGELEGQTMGMIRKKLVDRIRNDITSRYFDESSTIYDYCHPDLFGSFAEDRFHSFVEWMFSHPELDMKRVNLDGAIKYLEAEPLLFQQVSDASQSDLDYKKP